MFHLGLHVLIPLIVSITFYKNVWQKAFLLMILGMAIDLDHFLADPIYDPERCSIGFHPLHTHIPIAIYVSLIAFPRFRILGIGLTLHIALDFFDCS